MGNRNKRIDVAVIGLGRFGSSVALSLEAQGHYVLGIDEDPDIVQAISDQLSQAVVLDSTNEEALLAVDITAFDTVVVAIGSDFESNLLTTVALKAVGVRYVICKAPRRRQRDILLKVGADRVIQPEHEAGMQLAEELSTPSVLDKLPLGPDHQIAEMIIPTAFAYKTLAQTNLRQKFGVSVLLVKHDHHIHVTPPADYLLQPKDVIIILGRTENIANFVRLE